MDVDTESVLVERSDGVGVVRLNRPDRLNAMTREMSLRYASVMRELDRDPNVRVILVTGNGRGFCAGADLDVLGQDLLELSECVPPIEDMPALGFRLATPVVAAVNGPTAGVGFAYMLGADVRFCSADAKITTSFARLGLVAEYGLSWLLPRVVGLGRAMDLLLSGRTISGAEAGEMGLAEFVLPADEVFAAALAYARQIAAHCSPFSLEAIKGQVLSDSTADLDGALVRSRWLQERSFRGRDLRDSLATRTERRAPVIGRVPTGPTDV
ncbi:enoyl-CoA hydratase-related protein [Cryptosporangium sp. NPDC051539]|uniref:enoyl-CoA hydratase-related protein n=1 Tax=Cryptosporangium sp. NPDC051539 TaxID=3363962 RepID=UPI0037B6CA17